MIFPFQPIEVPLESWQRQFRSACDERAWFAASELLVAHPFNPEVIAKPNAFGASLAEFISEAPLNAVIGLGLPECTNPSPAWRSTMIGQLIRAHLLKAQGAISAAKFSLLHYHLQAAFHLRPRVKEHEASVVCVFAEATRFVGSAELELGNLYPLAESTDGAAPHPEDFRLTVGVDYHPCLLPSLLDIAADSGASDAFLELGLRCIAWHTHWPTWRALAASENRPSHLRAAARVILATDTRLSAESRGFLEAYANNKRFEQMPPKGVNGDIAF